MKYFVAPLLALLLVGYPTLSGVVREDSDLSITAGPVTPGGPEIDIDVVRADLAILNRLVDLTDTPYLSGAIPAPAANSRLAEVAGAWQGHASLGAEAAVILQTMHDFPDPLSANDAQRDPQIAKVSQVIERLTHDAAKSLAKDYEGQLTTIKTAKLRLADAQKALAEGQKLFSDRNWIGTTDKLVPVKQQLQELLRQLTQPAPEPWQDRLTDEAKTARDEAETLIKRAEFCRQGDPLRERVNHENDGPPEKWAPLVRDLRPVVGMGPPSPTDTELFAWLQRALKSLEARDALYRLSLQPACPLRPWLDKLKPILANADKFAEDYAKTILPEVLKRSLPEKRSADEGFREAVTVDGEVLVGTWQETGIGYYHFRRRGADIDETWLSKKLKQTPTEPLAVRCGKQYNPALEKLFEQLGDRGIWDGFLTLCQSLQGDLAQRGEVAGGVSFHKEIKFAQEVLASWADIEPFLRP